MGLLAGKAIAVTGSTRGLGRAYAVAAAREGGNVVVNGRNPDAVSDVIAAITREGGRAVGVTCDVSTWEGASQLIRHCLEQYGRVDGLVNNAAGIAIQPEPWLHSEAEIRQLLRVNTEGPIFCGVLAARQMVAQGSGSIINVLSGAVVGVDARALYGATKGALASWTYGLALDLEGTGVRVNGLSPTAQTEMSPPNSIRPSPESAAPMVVYLLSELSERLNGHVLRISGSNISAVVPAAYLASLVSPEWTPQAIAEAVETTLRDQLGAVGLLARNVSFGA